MDSFSNQLRKVLSSKQWNQMRAATELGLTQSQISDYLSGKSEPYLSTAVAIAKRLGISLDELSGIDAAGVVVREEDAAYHADESFSQWVERLKRRWRRKERLTPKWNWPSAFCFPKRPKALSAG